MATLLDTPRGVGGKIDRNAHLADQAAQAGLPENPALYGVSTATPTAVGTTPPAPASTSLNSTSLTPTSNFNLTPAATPTQADGFQGYLGALSTQNINKRKELDSQRSDLLSTLLKGDTKSGLESQLYADNGVDAAATAKHDIDSKLVASQHAQQREIDALGKNGALTPAQLAAQTAAINRRYTTEQADLAVQKFAADGDYYGAKEVADRAVNALMEKQKNEYEALKFNYEENRDLFTIDEQRAFTLAQDERKRNLENEEYRLRQTFQQTIDQQNALFNQKITQQNAAYSHSLDYGGGGSYNGDFEATINNVANLESTVAGKQAVASNLKSYIAAGDYKSAYGQIANSVEAGLVGEPKRRFADARTDVEVMSGLKTAIQQYADAGGDTNLLKGTAESIYNKLGTVKDPKFKSLAVQLQREFQTYRNAMTGAAFSPQESAEYQSVNPTGNNTLNLNLSVIDGALAQLNNRVASTIKSRAGEGAVYIKEYADGVASQTSAAQTTTTQGDPEFLKWLQTNNLLNK